MSHSDASDESFSTINSYNHHTTSHGSTSTNSREDKEQPSTTKNVPHSRIIAPTDTNVPHQHIVMTRLKQLKEIMEGMASNHHNSDTSIEYEDLQKIRDEMKQTMDAIDSAMEELRERKMGRLRGKVQRYKVATHMMSGTRREREKEEEGEAREGKAKGSP